MLYERSPVFGPFGTLSFLYRACDGGKRDLETVDSDFRSRRRKLQLVVLSISALLRSDVSAFASSCCPCFPPPPALTYLFTGLFSTLRTRSLSRHERNALPASCAHVPFLSVASAPDCRGDLLRSFRHQRSYVAWLFLLCHPVCGSL